MSPSRRRAAAALALPLAAFVGFAYARPVTLFEWWLAVRLRLSGVRNQQLPAGPYRIHALEAGSGPPLVLIHGLSSNATFDWGRAMVPLSRHFHVYALDLPGFGHSERPPGADYGVPMQVAAVRDFMQAAGVARARVAGVSMGGWIAARLAGEHPEQVERLLVVAGGGMRPVVAPIPVELLFPRDEDGVRRLVAAVRHKAPVPPSFVARDILSRRLRDEWILRRAVDSIRRGRDWLDGTLARAVMPVLVVWGRDDRLIPVAYAEPLQAEFPHAELVVLDGCGHMPMADCPDAFDDLALRFLTGSAVAR